MGNSIERISQKSKHPNKNEDDEVLRSELYTDRVGMTTRFKKKMMNKNFKSDQYSFFFFHELPVESRTKVVPNSGYHSIYS